MRKLLFILFITISSCAKSQVQQVYYTNVLHGDTAFLVKVTNTYQLDSQIRYIYTNHLECDSVLVQDTMRWVCDLILDTTQYWYPFKTLISSVRDSSQVTHPKIRDTIIWLRNQISTLIQNNSTGAGRDILNISTPASNSLVVVTSGGNGVLRTETQIKQDLQIDQINNTSDVNKPISTAAQTALDGKQATLVSGTNIKTINGLSLLGSGDVQIAGGEAFPVGSIFISAVNTNPNTLLGYGTWEAFGAGRVLIGQDPNDTDFDVAEETGGNKTVTISASNLPQLSVTVTDPGHTHVQNKNTATTGPLSGTTPDASTNSSAASDYSTASSTTGITATANTGGANTALNIMPPTIVVYFWKRTN